MSSNPDGDPASLLTTPRDWSGSSRDPNDEQFGDVVKGLPFTSDALADSDLVLVGEPYDGAVIGRKGAVDGPTAIRSELASVKTHRFGYGPVSRSGDEPSKNQDRTAAATIVDVGDVALEDVDVTGYENETAAVQDRIATVAADVHDSSATPLFLGGDNSLTVGNVRPLIEQAHVAGERVGVVNFDAHLDVREPRDGPSSGTPYRQLVEAGLDDYLVVGARAFETSTAYADYVDDVGGTVLTPDALDDGLDSVLARISSATAAVDRLYVSVDLDVLDAAAAPGVSAPTPGGFSTRELFSLVTAVAADDRVAGFELVETAPSLDPASVPDSPAKNRTVVAAARVVANFVAGFGTSDDC